ncbi:LysR family transcriptional regulator [Catenovulum sediminis]|uniref:LysR family transcriptional regulator n=1 Tax=Catenovulum sediminis TaxID=1740262 RepID=A0ABV1RET1_9ALTE
MDWRSVNFDWNHARAFLVTAEEGSLSAAARALNTSQPTLSRQVAALENELNIVLFERHGKGLVLTENGLDLLNFVRTMGEAANQFSLSASGRSESLEGQVCISASEAIATFILPAIVAKMRKIQPGIQIQIIASNDASDLKRREADIAIRSFWPSQQDLITKRIRDFKFAFYATPAYISSLAGPVNLACLSQADFIGFSGTDGGAELYQKELIKLGFAVSEKNFPVKCENHIVLWELTKQGLGIGVMLQEVGDAEDKVQAVLPAHQDWQTQAWLVVHQELKSSKKIRFVFDFLAEQLAG